MALGWNDAKRLNGIGWTCGYCGREVGGNIGYSREYQAEDKFIYICPRCENPSAFIRADDGVFEQYPRPATGGGVENLPQSVSSLYGEVRRCVQCAAYTSAVLSMRKLLMHVAVEQGAEPDKSFFSYVEYLDENHWIPPNCRTWVDAIRKSGNEANHEIALATEQEAKRLLDFTEMLLKLVYEFPARLAD